MAARRSPTRLLSAATLLLASALPLAGCTAPTPTDTPTSAASSPAETPAAPVALVPDGTADENLPYFEQVLHSVVDPAPEAPGRAVVDALVAAGFSKDAMQLTADETSVGLTADSVQVSVKMSDACLIGQYGAKSDGVRAIVAAPITTGACLVGRTVSLAD
ncbi:hypothetical protein ITJ46_07260 [Rathayibacter sp. VKM Ac-2878]|nr:hypothetical protein [Rathayibacter sp. VKM Ac-2879]MBF4503737.1 hypothetical protein [Rathayibacter sp. VKM Ac-2878]